jgi:hypothetical protein
VNVTAATTSRKTPVQISRARLEAGAAAPSRAAPVGAARAAGADAAGPAPSAAMWVAIVSPRALDRRAY